MFSSKIFWGSLVKTTRRLAKSVRSPTGSKFTNMSSCKRERGANMVRTGSILARKENLPNCKEFNTPPNGRFQETKRASRSPDKGASREKRLGSSTLKIIRVPAFTPNSWARSGLTQKFCCSRSGAWLGSFAKSKKRSSIPKTCTPLARTLPSGDARVP